MNYQNQQCKKAVRSGLLVLWTFKTTALQRSFSYFSVSCWQFLLCDEHLVCRTGKWRGRKWCQASKSNFGLVWPWPLIPWPPKLIILFPSPTDNLCQFAAELVHSFSTYRIHKFASGQSRRRRHINYNNSKKLLQTTRRVICPKGY